MLKCSLAVILEKERSGNGVVGSSDEASSGNNVRLTDRARATIQSTHALRSCLDIFFFCLPFFRQSHSCCLKQKGDLLCKRHSDDV